MEGIDIDEANRIIVANLQIVGIPIAENQPSSMNSIDNVRQADQTINAVFNSHMKVLLRRINVKIVQFSAECNLVHPEADKVVALIVNLRQRPCDVLRKLCIRERVACADFYHLPDLVFALFSICSVMVLLNNLSGISNDFVDCSFAARSQSVICQANISSCLIIAHVHFCTSYLGI